VGYGSAGEIGILAPIVKPRRLAPDEGGAMKTNPKCCAVAMMGLLLPLVLPSCGTLNHAAVDHLHYEKTPDGLSTRLWRAAAKSTPWSARRAFYANWGGPGNTGGKPADRMDEGFRRHDIVYMEARSLRNMRKADQELVVWLESIDESTLDEAGKAYRQRAIAFMKSPLAAVVGKPLSALFRASEPVAGCFRSPADVVALFDPSSPGMPTRPDALIPEGERSRGLVSGRVKRRDLSRGWK